MYCNGSRLRASASPMSMSIIALALTTAATAATAATPAATLEALISRQSISYNVSIAAAATLANGTTLAAAAGWDNRASGTKINTRSLFPSGSVTKTFTATAAMRLVEQGKLKLDAPFHTIVDPWLQAQGKPTMKAIWGGDATIEAVTVAHLLQMRSGIGDYNDLETKLWQLTHPTLDITPDTYVANVSKKFPFPPGEGGSYTGIGYVLLGCVLCASTDGCKSWADLDQKALLQAPTFSPSDALNETIFMRGGLCSGYPAVVHQYSFMPGFRQTVPAVLQDLSDLLEEAGRASAELTSPRRAAEVAPIRFAAPRRASAPPRHCTDHSLAPGGQKLWFPHAEIVGPSFGEKNITTGGAEGCCALADSVTDAYLWTFYPSGSGEGGTCRFFAAVPGITGKSSLSATSGKADPVLSEEDFVDLYPMSCLNGWTMGNIATTPSEATQFYHALFGGEIVSASGLKAMTSWKPLTTGFAKGVPYGFGLMAQQFVIPLDVNRCPDDAPLCKCRFLQGCRLEAYQIGHPGLDYGSGMPAIGYVLGLNISYAVASNTGESVMGMNSTLGVAENLDVLDSVECQFFDIVIHAQMPSYPKFKCPE